MAKNIIAKHGLDVALGLSDKSKSKFYNDLSNLLKDVGKKTEQEFAQSLVNVMDEIFKAAGKQSPFNVADVVSVEGFGKQIANELIKGMSAGLQGGVGSISSDSVLSDELSKQLEKLKAERKSLIEEKEKLRAQIKNKTDIEKLNKFDPYDAEPLKIDGDIVEEAQKILDKLYNYADKIQQLQDEGKRDTKDYIDTVLDAQKAYNDFYRMQQTLKHTKTDIPKDLRAEYDAWKHSNDEDNYKKSGGRIRSFDLSDEGDTIVYAFEDLSDVVVDASADLQRVEKSLERINAEIEEITNNANVAKSTGASALNNVLKEEKDIEEARKRMLNKGRQGGYNQPKVKKLNEVVGDESIHIKDSLEKIKFEYDKSVANEEGWEQQYQWLVKFVKKYDELKSSGALPEQLNKFQDVYNSFIGQYPEAISSLKELRDVINSTPSKKTSNKIPIIVEPEVENPISTPKEITGGKEEIKVPVKPVILDADNDATIGDILDNDKDSSYAPGGILNNPKYANLFGKTTEKDASSGLKQVNKTLEKQSGILVDISKLTSYIDEEYLSAGKHLSDFLDDLQKESNELDSELKEILTTLHLIDENGNLTFDIKRNGEDGGGTTHGGALISDDFVLIERGDYQRVKDSKLPTATKDVYDEGVNVAKVLGYLPSKHTNAFFDVQTPAKGHNLFENGMLSQDVINATEEQLQQLVNAFIVARNHGFDIENGGSNIVYDKDKGFSFYDLEEWDSEDKEEWDSLSEVGKIEKALEDALSIFNGFNRDNTNFANDPNKDDFINKFIQAIEHDSRFRETDYKEIFDEVFDSQIHEELSSIYKKIEGVDNDNEKSEYKNTGDASSAEFQAAQEEAERLRKEKETLQNDLELADIHRQNAQADLERERQESLDKNVKIRNLQDENTTLNNELLKKDGAIQNLNEQLAKVQTSNQPDAEKQQGITINEEQLKGVLSSITYNVKMSSDGVETEANKVAIDEQSLRAVLESITYNTKSMSGDDQPTDSAHAPWALEDTLSGQTNPKLDSINTVLESIKAQGDSNKNLPVSDVGNVLATENTLGEIKSLLEGINSKVISGKAKIIQDESTPEANKALSLDVKGGKQVRSDGMSEYTAERVKTAFTSLTKLKTSLQEADQLSGNLEVGIEALYKELSKVSDSSDLAIWNEHFKQFKNGSAILQALSKDYAKLGKIMAQFEAETDPLKKSQLEDDAQILSDSIAIKSIDVNVDDGRFDEVYQRAFNLERHRLQQKTELETAKEQKDDQDKKDKKRADTLKELEAQYKQLGQAQAKAEADGTRNSQEKVNQILNEINAKEQSLVLSQQEAVILKQIAEEAKAKKAVDLSTSAADSTEKQAIRELTDLYKKLGQAEARRDMTSKNVADEVIADNEVEAIKKEIEQKRQLIKINDELEGKFTKARTIGTEKETIKAVEDLGKQYKELGKLRAEIDETPSGEHKSYLQGQLATLEDIVALETKRLGISDEQQESFSIEADKAYYAERSKLEEKAAKDRDKIRKKEQVDVLKQDDMAQKKRDNEAWNAKKKSARASYGVDYAQGAFNVGTKTVNEVIANQDISSEIEAKARQLQDSVKALDEAKRAVLVAINAGEDVDSKALLEQANHVNTLTKELQELWALHQKYSGDNVEILPDDITPLNGLDNTEYRQRLTEMAEASVKGKLTNIQFDESTRELTGTVKTGANTFTTYSFAVDKVDGNLKKMATSTKKTESFIEGVTRKMKELSQYAIGSFSIYDVFNQLRQGVQYIREIDSALVELRKVTDETEESYARFIDTASKTASKVGSTVKDMVNSTADWARLGYSMEEAAGLAESTAVLLNVSEFDNIDSATSALISTIQAFGYTASESMEVVDVMNIIGNNFAVSTDGLATALQDSASALMSANNSYQEASAMVAAANKVAQDPSKVGGGLRTISLRLRGTEVDGEDNEGLIKSTSKLQSKIKGLTGVDILTDTGAYKSTYQILLEISRVWQEMSDIDQAALLEIIAGKNRSNIAAALLSNTEDLEAAYETAMNAEGKQNCLNVQKCA